MAMWTYLTQPFTFTLPGFETSELEPSDEAGQQWRRLGVTWPRLAAARHARRDSHLAELGILPNQPEACCTIPFSVDSVHTSLVRRRQSYMGAPPMAKEAPASTGRIIDRLSRPSLRWTGLLVAGLVGAAVTTLVVTVPSLRFAYHRVTLHAQIATASALVALLVSMLAAGRFRRLPTASDLLLAVSFAVLGGSNLLFSVIPAATGRSPSGLATWLPLSGRLIAAALLAAAALVPARIRRRPAHAARTLVAATVCSLGLLAVVLATLGPDLPQDAGGGHPAGAVPYRVLSGTTGSIVLKGISAALVVVAAAGFTARRRRRLDWFSVFLTWGTTLLAFAWLDYLLVPSLYVDWFYAGDVLALGAYLLLAAGAVGEIRAYQRDRARLAAIEERARVARELHDGVAQELLYLLGQARRLHKLQPGPVTERMLSAAERALDESRAAISTLRVPLDESLHEALERAAGELGRRLDLDVRVSGEPTLQVAPPVREALMRIVGEALSNAARHGGARTAAIELRDGEPCSVTVRDDGCGFDPDARRPSRDCYGLLAMRERAEAFGGGLAIRSAPGAGTEVEVALS
jgi:signal transduction histidine kinase